MTQPMICPKCSGEMENGFMIEHGYGPGEQQVRWVEGKPIPRFWSRGVNLEGREPLPVTTFRCEGCGYLESFATQT